MSPQDCPKSCIAHVRVCDTPNNITKRLFISRRIRNKLFKALRIKGFHRIATALLHCSGLNGLKDLLQAIASFSMYMTTVRPALQGICVERGMEPNTTEGLLKGL